MEVEVDSWIVISVYFSKKSVCGNATQQLNFARSLDEGVAVA
jgi:hypothetical protein